MKRISRPLLAALLLLAPCAAFSLDVPALRGRVNDYAGILSPDAASRIEQKLAGIERTDSTQIAVLTVPSLEGEVLEEYSIRVAEAWKIGMKNLDNGVILLIARDDRKLRIEVGRGLEGKLTDLLSGRIIRNEITPRFRSGDYDGGIEAGIDAIIAVVRGEYSADQAESTPGEGEKGSSAFTGIIVLFFLVVMLGGIAKLLGGAAGAVGLPIVGALAYSGLGIGFLAALAGIGFVLGIIISFMFGRGGHGGGFFMGGLGGGGGSFSGGFSGGGGSFGGGGASGSW